MGTRKKLLKGAGYIAAPKLSFAVHHPRQAAMASLATWAMGHMTHRRRRHHHMMGSTTAKGLGAAAIALPVGLWLGRRIFGHREPQVAPM